MHSTQLVKSNDAAKARSLLQGAARDELLEKVASQGVLADLSMQGVALDF